MTKFFYPSTPVTTSPESVLLPQDSVDAMDKGVERTLAIYEMTKVVSEI